MECSVLLFHIPIEPVENRFIGVSVLSLDTMRLRLGGLIDPPIESVDIRFEMAVEFGFELLVLTGCHTDPPEFSECQNGFCRCACRRLRRNLNGGISFKI